MRRTIADKVISRLEMYVNSYVNRKKLIKYNVTVGSNIVINGKILIFTENMVNQSSKCSSIFLGNNIKINSGMKYNPIGGNERTILRTIEEGIIEIGNNVGMSNVAVVSHKKISVEDDVTIGGGTVIYDSDFHSLQYAERMLYPDSGIVSKPVLIKRGAFIGAHSIILKGVTIGEQSIVAAGAVVTKDIPDRQIWGGSPAKYIRDN